MPLSPSSANKWNRTNRRRPIETHHKLAAYADPPDPLGLEGETAMIPCETHQRTLMDYVHGLLEPEEVTTLETHLAECEPCSAALERERAMLDTFRKAAQGSFPEVQFVAPRSEPVVEVAPNPKGNLATTLSRWAIMASVLLIVAGLGIPPLRTGISYVVHKQPVNQELAQLRQSKAEERQLADEIKQKEDELQTKLDDAKKTHDELADEWVNAEAKALKSEQESSFKLQVSGPTSIIPDAPNSYTLKLQTKANQPITAKGTVELRTQDGKVLHTIQTQTRPQTGEASFTLPARVWRGIPADSKLTLDIHMTDAQNNVGQISKSVSLQQPVFTTFLTTDKPMYQPSETLYFRSVTLNRATFLPPDELMNLRFEMIAPSGQPVPGMELVGLAQPSIPLQDGKFMPVNGPNGKPIEGVGTGAFELPPTIVGGEYTLNVYQIRVNNMAKENGSKP